MTECDQGAVRTKDSQFHGFHTIYIISGDDQPCDDAKVNYECFLVMCNASCPLYVFNGHGLLEEALAPRVNTPRTSIPSAHQIGSGAAFRGWL